MLQHSGHDRVASYSTQFFIACIYKHQCRSRLPRSLRRRSAAARLLRLWVRIPPRGMNVCVCYECCVLYRQRSLCRADHSSRGVLPTVVHRCVLSTNLKTKVMTHVEPQRHTHTHIHIFDVVRTVQHPTICI